MPQAIPVCQPASSSDTLTADQLQVRADLLATAPDASEIQRAERVADTTTAALLAHAAFLESVDDTAGAALLRRYAADFANYEATVL